MTATNLSATLNSAHLSPTARGVIATLASAAGTAAAPICVTMRRPPGSISIPMTSRPPVSLWPKRLPRPHCLMRSVRPVSTLPERRPYSRLRSSISICLPSVTAPAALSTSAPRPDGAFSPIRLRRIPNLLTYTPIDATATTIRAAKPMARPIGPMRAISLRAVCPKKR